MQNKILQSAKYIVLASNIFHHFKWQFSDNLWPTENYNDTI